MHPTSRRLITRAAPGLLLALLAPLATAHAQSSGRIWGTVHTLDGERHEGFLRFGGVSGSNGHAASWTDLFTGRENISEEPFRVWVDSARGGAPFLRTVEAKGHRVSWNELNDDFTRYVSFAVPVGSIREVVLHRGVDSWLRIELVLRRVAEGGEAASAKPEKRWVMGESAMSWVGESVNEVEDGRGGRTRVYGPDISRIEFAAAPAGSTASSDRLHGTIEDHSGRSFTGRITFGGWKVSPADRLTEWTNRSSPRRIAFGTIRSIERLPGEADEDPAPGVRVTLASGEVVELPDRSGPGSFSIAVLDPGLGWVSVGSRNFKSLRFHDPEQAPDPAPAGSSAPFSAGYEAFDNGAHLRGTVVTRSGTEYRGRIRWGTFKTTTWDHLRGSSEGMGMHVRFDRISRVEWLEFPYGEPMRVNNLEFERGRVRVTLADGRSYEMTGRDDLGEIGVGIMVLPTGQDTDSGWRRVGWENLREVRFEHGPPGGNRPPRHEGA